MIRPKPQEKGFTLIEVIVAIAIFSAMVTLAGLALNQGLQQYKTLMEQGLDFWSYARVLWAEKSLNSAADYHVQTKKDGWVPYFRGGEDGLSYVSRAPLTGRLPVVVWIRKEKDEAGMSSLVYYELPVFTKTGEDIEKNFSSGEYRNGSGIRLLSQADSVAFSYYGCDAGSRKHAWFNRFDGSRMKRLPEQIRISYRQDGRPGKMIFGLNVNSVLKMEYNAAAPASR